MMAFDECPPETRRATMRPPLALTERWLDQRFDRYHRTQPKYGHYQALFPIVRGMRLTPDLRAKAAENVKRYDADGYAIGADWPGEPTEAMYEMIEVVTFLPENPPLPMGRRHAGEHPRGNRAGVDIKPDCVMPTRNGRNGRLFTSEGIINIRNRKWEDDFSPIDPEGTAFVDTLYTKAYLHHLAVCGEMLRGRSPSAQHRLLPAPRDRGPRTHRGGRLCRMERDDGRKTAKTTLKKMKARWPGFRILTAAY